MDRYSLQEAQTHLQKLIDDAREGKTVVILGDGGLAVQLVPVTKKNKPRKAGSAKGQVKIAEDFDAPLSDFDEYIKIAN